MTVASRWTGSSSSSFAADTRLATPLLGALIALGIAAISSACVETPPTQRPTRSDCPESEICGSGGWIVVEVDITPSGTVENAEVVAACPDDSFNRRALIEIRRWKWEPSADGIEDHSVRLCRP